MFAAPASEVIEVVPVVEPVLPGLMNRRWHRQFSCGTKDGIRADHHAQSRRLDVAVGKITCIIVSDRLL